MTWFAYGVREYYDQLIFKQGEKNRSNDFHQQEWLALKWCAGCDKGYQWSWKNRTNGLLQPLTSTDKTSNFFILKGPINVTLEKYVDVSMQYIFFFAFFLRGVVFTVFYPVVLSNSGRISSRLLEYCPVYMILFHLVKTLLKLQIVSLV